MKVTNSLSFSSMSAVSSFIEPEVSIAQMMSTGRNTGSPSDVTCAHSSSTRPCTSSF